MKLPRNIALAICVLLVPTTAIAQSGPRLNRDPEAVKFVTSDIGNFWRAYDLAAKETDKGKRAAVFQAEYLDKGSPGLKDRSEEHTSELQSRQYLVCRLLLAKNLISLLSCFVFLEVYNI